MLRCLSTHIFLKERLHPGLLELTARSGADAIEIFAARQHFDYTSREHVQELAGWFASNPLEPWSMHAPLYPDREMGRAGAPAVNLLHPEKSRRIDAMDEIKRALETAEHIHFKNLVVHLGERHDSWSPRALEHAMTALEHLDAFARPLGVRLLAENIINEPTTPEHLMEIFALGHLTRIGVCLDTGHAHMTIGLMEAIRALGNRIVSVHVHDNHAVRDEHLWPGDGTIDWEPTMAALKALPVVPACVLEIHHALAETHSTITAKAQAAYQKLAG
jgi:sugar phosphate isomerase/epimerase